ncbi:hypothetical protein [Streptococcus equi]|uniref:hypothetical protein n=1 Tax=Streptococcus equi TaxID=1336 RepID=UPI001BDE7110|nr:hypothetical protein [Streptococcus equi]MBT1234941.1 hypothetical protein [Streptococcus equi subsp. equi]
MLTFDFYNKGYCGSQLNEEKFGELSKRAERNFGTFWLIGLKKEQVKNLPLDILEAVKMAVCAQIEYLNAIGVESAIGVTSVTQAKVGNFSYTDGKKATVSASVGSVGVSPDVLDYLLPSGLLYKGVNTRW